MWPQDIVAYALSRQQDLLPSNRIDGLVNSISVTDQSEGRRLIAQITHAAVHISAIVRAAFSSAGKRVAESFSVHRPSTP